MPKVVDHDAYRLQLMGKAFHIFAEKGYGFPIRSLAREMGVSTGTLYHYFPGKKELFEQMAMWITESFSDEKITGVPQSLTTRQRLELYKNMILDSKRDITAIILLSIEYGRLTDAEHASGFFRDMFEKYLQQMQEFLRLPQDVVSVLMPACDGIILSAWITNSPQHLRQHLELLLEIIVVYVDQLVEE